MRHTWIGVAMLVALSVARPTHAAASAGWTNGGMLGADTGGFYGLLGFPGMSVGYLRGVSESLDVGGRFSFNYGGEGVPSLNLGVGFKVAGDVKLKLDPGLPFGAFTLRALPGIHVLFPPGFTFFNLALPVELALGVPIAPNLLVHVSVEAPLAIGLWTGFGVSPTVAQVPVLFGGGGEFKVDRALSLHAQLHIGPYVQIIFGGATTTYFAFDSLLGITYRLP